MIKFIAQIKLISSKTLLSSDREIEIKIRTNDPNSLQLTSMQGDRLAQIQVEEYSPNSISQDLKVNF